MREVASYAAERDITLGLEPVNRYETYLYNTIADTLELIDVIGAPNVTIHADTYHMKSKSRVLSGRSRRLGDDWAAFTARKATAACRDKAMSIGTMSSVD